jgi:hypothetical protein
VRRFRTRSWRIERRITELPAALPNFALFDAFPSLFLKKNAPSGIDKTTFLPKSGLITFRRRSVRRKPWLFVFLSLLAGAAAASVTTTRDRIASEADTFFNCYWDLRSVNILNDPLVGTVCAYTRPGYQQGVSYKVDGFDTVESFLDGIALGAGAGDIEAPTSDPRCVGVDCSGFVSHAWETSRQYTWTMYTVADQVAPYQLRMGDIVNWSGHHTMLFLHWITPGDMLVYESTSIANPGRVIERTVSFPLTNNPFIPMRCRNVQSDPEPVVLAAYEDAPRHLMMPWDGASVAGYRVQYSTDGTSWSTALGENSCRSFIFQASANLPANTDYFLRVVAVNSGGATTPPSDAVAVRFSSTGAPKVLIVDGLDSLRHRDGVDHPGHTFVIPIAKSLSRLGYAYETCANEMVVVNQIDLSKYAAVIWLTGEDSVIDEALSQSEQYQLQNFLEGGGKLLISGSNIAWDLSHQTPTSGVTAADEQRYWDDTDQDFLTHCLHLNYLDKTLASKHLTVGIPGTPFQGLTVNFDDGTHGTYDVRMPDVFTPAAGGLALLCYGTGTRAAAVGYHGTFGDGTQAGTVVTLGFGLETVYDSAQRDALLRTVLGF